jgi:hypothetical protein
MFVALAGFNVFHTDDVVFTSGTTVEMQFFDIDDDSNVGAVIDGYAHVRTADGKISSFGPLDVNLVNAHDNSSRGEVCATGFVPDVGTADRTTKTRGTLADVNIVNVQDDRSRGAPVVMDVRTGTGKTNTLGLLADVVVNVHDDSSRGAAVVLDVGLGSTLGLLAEVNIVNAHNDSSRDEVV